ncbi:MULTISPECIES: PTS sugar transporter subunit IIB [Pasteurellaceae]|uniref:PTS sugar transporter subunit IIB n=1 Tax=Pasteurella atlantica TaxID=2827233 RepID=A0AAW8CQK5_9PAST|nr:PTS sugar transporter subunit IIB [Pasteurella atlantica]MBR0573773.1 PTS sugar transporter subunit IIB [Pasteurella atlantica]MDP8039709.1 PTS sugar transporter subunit IIB [Pasteurella atlantica]MDP8041894.1 PTS sugar transporter subunit IIB [Pasteurella atlantica]MDP8044081.1 PTS sugar transporter subunit IIB [Pasteurella atlantica]MDP8046059.1 PTS sugar transporter subunit IIB [Pasteurella atlantica]
MTNILLICTAGMSTSALVEKMKKAVTARNLDIQIQAIAESTAEDFVGKADVVLLGPQIKYLVPKMTEMFNPTPVSPINMVDYGMMNGEKVLDSALALLEEK